MGVRAQGKQLLLPLLGPRAGLRELGWRDFSGLIFFDPASIRQAVLAAPPGRFVKEGEWDVDGVGPMEDVRKLQMQTVRMIFADGAPYQETPQYRRMMEGVRMYDEGERDPLVHGAYWCTSGADVDEYFHTLARAFDDIKAHGYMTQSELHARRPGDVRRGGEDEIQLLVDRRGQLVLGMGGTHRLTMVKILGLERVPGQVMGVHIDWALRQVGSSWLRGHGSVAERLRSSIAHLSL